MMIKSKIIIYIFILSSAILSAQKYDNIRLDYSQFLENVRHYNLGYAAEQFNVDIAEAEMIQARAFPDPELQLAYFDNGELTQRLGVGFSGQVDWTVELGHKRKARMDLSKSQYELSKLALADYFKNLKADASLIFIDAIYKKEILKVKENSFQMMRDFAAADAIRFKLGVISETDARQSKLEAIMIEKELIQAKTEYLTAKNKVILAMGKDNSDNTLEPIADLQSFQDDFIADDLINIALHNRTDLMIALQNKDVNQKSIILAKANRKIDLGVNLAISHSTVAVNELAYTPQFTQVQVGVSFPLKLSNKLNNELKIAQLQLNQNETLLKQVELQIKSEVRETIAQYESYRKQVDEYDLKMIKDAKLILDAKKYSYKRGNSSLLEILDAQRTYNDVQTSYLESLYNCATTNIQLKRVIGN